MKGRIIGDSFGYRGASGPGRGIDDCTSGGGGGSHGGYGGGRITLPYGDARAPIACGSGGGGSCTDGVNGFGGGALHLIATTLTLNGNISSNGYVCFLLLLLLLG